MKLNRKRKDARFPNWILELLASLQTKYQWTFTEALIRCAEKGAAYYNKQWMKMHPNQKGPSEERPNADNEDSSDTRQDDTPITEEEKRWKKMTDKEKDEYLNELLKDTKEVKK